MHGNMGMAMRNIVTREQVARPISLARALWSVHGRDVGSSGSWSHRDQQSRKNLRWQPREYKVRTEYYMLVLQARRIVRRRNRP